MGGLRYVVSDAEGNVIAEDYVHPRPREPRIGDVIRLGDPMRDLQVVASTQVPDAITPASTLVVETIG